MNSISALPAIPLSLRYGSNPFDDEFSKTKLIIPFDVVVVVHLLFRIITGKGGERETRSDPVAKGHLIKGQFHPLRCDVVVVDVGE